MSLYIATLVYLDGIPKIRVRTENGYLVGYFTDVNKITYHGMPVDLADVTIEERL